MFRHLILLLPLVALTMHVAHVLAQGAFPAPLPGESAAPPSKALLFPQAPSVVGNSSDACKDFIPLREEADRRGKLIKAASERHVPPEEACRLVQDFYRSEIKMIEYVEANSNKCEIPRQVAEMLSAGHKNTEAIQTRVCSAALEARENCPSLPDVLGPPKREPPGPVGDFDKLR